MTTLGQASALAKGIFGSAQVSKATGTITVATLPLFTIANGDVAITALYGKVTTDITVAGTTKLQHNPTTGTTGDLVTATDLGTTDTLAGALLSISGVVADSIVRSVGWAELGFKQGPLVVTAGQIEMVTATGADGAITWYVNWVPMQAGATLVAA
jgi:hypothetical protein